MGRWRSRFHAVVFSLLGLLGPLPAARAADGVEIPRHALELQALENPGRVLQLLPAALAAAQATNAAGEQALLLLAQANACRVMANWSCQRDAGTAAAQAARRAGQPVSEIRGRIAEARGHIALHDFGPAETSLGEAEVLLRQSHSAELAADIDLAYSSLSHLLGKHVLAARYANQGLARLDPGQALAMRVRLLRNRGRAEAQLGQHAEAAASLLQAVQEVGAIADPKLVAEIELELARLAEQAGDQAAQLARGQRVLGIALDIGNVQLQGLAHEMIGLAQLGAGALLEASHSLQAASDIFRQLRQQRDELRVLQSQVRAGLAATAPWPQFEPVLRRWLELDGLVSGGERAQEGDDFEAQVRYAEQALQVQQLEAGMTLKAAEERQTLALLTMAMALLGVLAIMLLLQRQAHRQLRASEARYRVLADHTRDLVVRMQLDGQRLYVSPSASGLLGWTSAELLRTSWERVHPEDREELLERLRSLGREGGTRTLLYRTRHRNGTWVWIEALASRVPSPERPGELEIVYSGRDVTARVVAEQALAQAEQRLRAIADHIPALIALIDADERYLFANAVIGQTFGIDPQSMLGRTMREVRGAAVYADIQPYVAAALRGEPVSFEGSAEVAGRHYHYQSNYVPDIGADGRVQGFYALTFDITERKASEQRQAASEARLRLITNNLPALIAYVDGDERYRFCNDAFKERLGLEPGQMLGSSLREVGGEQIYGQVEPHVRLALAGTRTRFESFVVADGQALRWQSEYIPDLAEDGAVRGFYAMSVDTTAIHAAEQKCAAAEHTEALHQLLGQLAGSFSNQLAVVYGYLESIDVDSITAADLEITRLSLEDVLRLVEQVQLLAGYSGARFDRVAVATLAEDLARQWQREAHGVRLELDVDAGLPLIQGNTMLLRSALLELLENARDAAADGAGPIKLDATQMPGLPAMPGLPLVQSPVAARNLVISVSDSGCGMDESVLRRAGDPFFSTRSGRKGLGLSLVAGIVRVHSGQAWVDSRDGQGTTVTLALPLPGVAA